jgi:hypothetical protein
VVALNPRTDEPMDFWPKGLRKHHEEYTQRLFDQSTAKVWVLFGEQNRDRCLQHTHRLMPDGAIIKVRLRWDNAGIESKTFDGTKPSFAFEYGPQPDCELLRIIIFAYHPEALAYSNGTIPKGAMMDSAVNLAASLTGLPVVADLFEQIFDLRCENPYSWLDLSTPGIVVIDGRARWLRRPDPLTTGEKYVKDRHQQLLKLRKAKRASRHRKKRERASRNAKTIPCDIEHCSDNGTLYTPSGLALHRSVIHGLKSKKWKRKRTSKKTKKSYQGEGIPCDIEHCSDDGRLYSPRGLDHHRRLAHGMESEPIPCDVEHCSDDGKLYTPKGLKDHRRLVNGLKSKKCQRKRKNEKARFNSLRCTALHRRRQTLVC